MIRIAAPAGAAVFLFSSCATLPPQPTSLDHGLLIARAAARGAVIPFLVSAADVGTIAALDASGGPLPGMRAVSGLAAGGYIIFFDLPSGRYVLRTASFRSRGVRYQLAIPTEDANRRAVILRPGKAAFLGEYDYGARWPEWGVAVGRLGRIIGHWLTPWGRRPVLPRDADLSSFESGPTAEAAALRAVREELSGTQWRRAIDARLRELGAPEPVPVYKVRRWRELPLHEEPILAWRDTLKWGEPRRAPAGLVWRRPDGKALVAIDFTTGSAAGWDAAVSKLRRAALASVEDSGELYEVRVATRSGPAALVTSYRYLEGTLVGSATTVILTETVLICDGGGLFTLRLRAPRGEFKSVLPAYREFLLQLVLGPTKTASGPKSELVLPAPSAP